VTPGHEPVAIDRQPLRRHCNLQARAGRVSVLHASATMFSHNALPITMKRQLISSGSPFEEQIGYSRAVAQGPFVFVSGTTGFDYETMTIDDNVAVQAEQCLRNIEQALRKAGSSLADVVRVTYVLPNGDDFEACWPVLNRYFGTVRPAAMMVSAGLLDPRMKIEIEVTAMKQSP
jgi:enamine deaminase RidA (YjgF/YER057c/UK114 family)